MNLLFPALGETPYTFAIQKYSDINMLNYRISFFCDLAVDYYATRNRYVPSDHPLVKFLNNIVPSDDIEILTTMDINKSRYELLYKFISGTNGKYEDITYISTSLNDDYLKEDLTMIKTVYHNSGELGFDRDPYKDEILAIDLIAIALKYSRLVKHEEAKGINITSNIFVSNILLPASIRSRFDISVLNVITGTVPTFNNTLPIAIVDLSKYIVKFSQFIRKKQYSEILQFIQTVDQLVSIPNIVKGLDDSYNHFTFWIQDLIMSKLLLFTMRYSRKDEKALNCIRNIVRIRRQYNSPLTRYRRRRLEYVKIVVGTEINLNKSQYSSLTREFINESDIEVELNPLLLNSNETLSLPMIDSRVSEYYSLLDKDNYDVYTLDKIVALRDELTSEGILDLTSH